MTERTDKTNGNEPGRVVTPPTGNENAAPPPPEVVKTTGAAIPGAGAIAKGGIVKRVPLPTGSGMKLRMWVWLFLSVMLCLPPLVIELGVPKTTFTMEKIALLSSRETWQHQRSGRSDAWLVPTWNDQPRVNKPPMVVWLNMLAWSDLDPQTVDPQLLVWRARLLAVGMVMLGLIGTYWLSYSIGGVRVAAMATLIVGSCYIMLRHGRLATYDIHLFAWTTLSIAGGLWAMRPLRPVNWTGRRVLGWLFAGIALGAAIMTKGPVAALFMAVPLALAIAVCPQRRVGNAIGLLFALLAGALLAAPWYMYVIEKFPDAFKLMEHEYAARRAERQTTFYYLLIFVLAFPWTVYLIGAMPQPFVRAAGEHRRRLLIGWTWFIGMMVILAIPDAKQDRYLLPLLPAVGVLVAQLWAYQAYLADENLPDPGVNILRIPHWLMLIIGSLALPAFVIYQNDLIARGWLKDVELPGVGLPLAIGVGVALLAVALFGAIQHWRWKPVHAFGATFVWILIAGSFVQASYVHSHHGRYDPAADARKLAAVAGDDPVYCFYDPAQDARPDAKSPGNFWPEENFLFYAGRSIHTVTEDELAALAAKPCYIMLRLDDKATNAGKLTFHGFTPVFDFSDGRVVKGIDTDRCRLYRSPAVKQP